MKNLVYILSLILLVIAGFVLRISPIVSMILTYIAGLSIGKVFCYENKQKKE